MSPRADALRTVDQFQGEIAAIRAAPDPFSARATLYLLTAMVVAFAALLVFARVDRTVSSAGGRIVATVTPNVFQALDASIIKSIDVSEGEHVAKGQLLATLDPTFAAADVNQLREQIASYEAQSARDEAELAGRDLVFADGANDRYGKLQLALFSQRRAQYEAQINSFDQKIAQTQATIDKFQQDEAHYADREAIAKQVEDMHNTLLKKGAGSLLNVLTSTDTRIEALRTLDFGHNSLVEAQHQLSSLQADREAFVQQWRSALSQDLVTTRNSLDGARNQLDKALKHQDLVRLVAPEDSFVLSLAKLSVGSVLKEGDPLMTLTPANEPLEAEVEIGARDVGFIRAGDAATLKIDAFNFSEHGVAHGTVRWISEGAFTADANGAPAQPYYKARLRIDDINLKDVPASFRLIPGMTLTADVRVGERSLGAYMLAGVVTTFGDSMREP